MGRRGLPYKTSESDLNDRLSSILTRQVGHVCNSASTQNLTILSSFPSLPPRYLLQVKFLGQTRGDSQANRTGNAPLLRGSDFALFGCAPLGARQADHGETGL